MKIFTDDDTHYLQWVKIHPLGYVLNTTRPALPNFLILHIASCPAVSGEPAVGDYWTAEAIKVCALDKGELEIWARDQVGGHIQGCGLCKP